VQTLQPLIWLARRWTRLAVVSGTPAFFADALKAISAFNAEEGNSERTGPASGAIRITDPYSAPARRVTRLSNLRY
jgi:hypothetical protein